MKLKIFNSLYIAGLEYCPYYICHYTLFRKNEKNRRKHNKYR